MLKSKVLKYAVSPHRRTFGPWREPLSTGSAVIVFNEQTMSRTLGDRASFVKLQDKCPVFWKFWSDWRNQDKSQDGRNRSWHPVPLWRYARNPYRELNSTVAIEQYSGNFFPDCFFLGLAFIYHNIGLTLSTQHPPQPGHHGRRILPSVISFEYFFLPTPNGFSLSISVNCGHVNPLETF